MSVKKFEFDDLQRNWVVKACEDKIVSVARSKAKELPGSDVVRIRDGEMAVLRSIIALVRA